MQDHKVRRVVVQHDTTGRAHFAIDEVMALPSFGPNAFSDLMWVTAQSPADNMDPRDWRSSVGGLVADGGTVVRILDVAPGNETPMHRTLSIDYLIITKGEIDLELEGGDTRTVQAGDFVVQRGTNHRWINRSGEWMQMVAVLVSARPVSIGGVDLPEIHI